MDAHNTLTAILLVSTTIYALITLDVIGQAFRRNGWPWRATPVGWAEWSLPILFLSVIVHSAYRLVRHLGGDDQIEFLWTDGGRFAAALVVWGLLWYARFWAERHPHELRLLFRQRGYDVVVVPPTQAAADFAADLPEDPWTSKRSNSLPS